jgi:hypothetical protein
VGIDRAGVEVIERDGYRVDGEVAKREIAGDRVGAQAGDVDVPITTRGERAPGRELGRQLERRTAGGAGDLRGGAGDVAGDREIDVDDLATERRIAHRPADDPDVVASTEHPRCEAHRLRRSQALRQGHRSYRRGTRVEIPQVIS